MCAILKAINKSTNKVNGRLKVKKCTIFCILLYIMHIPLLNLDRFCIIIYKCTKLVPVLLELFILSLIKKHLRNSD